MLQVGLPPAVFEGVAVAVVYDVIFYLISNHVDAPY